jgi:protein-tyrosine phosphatase
MTNYIRLPLKKAYNVRDLGGYACRDGVTAFRRFVRADGLENLDEGDIAFLKEYGVKTVIDLRSADELALWPDPPALTAFADCINIPLIMGNALDDSRFADVPPGRFLAEYYLDILKNSQQAVRAVIETIASAREGGVLFHCVVGKDRTGTIAALLLGLVGVSTADILSNYEVTYTFIRQNSALMAQNAQSPIEHMYSPRDNLEAGLEHINTFGGISDYLEEIGVKPETLERVRNRLTA